MTPLVSILTPAYNASRYLPETIRSVLAQTWPRLEMIVVNDGSTDDTLAVARSFEGPNIKVIDQPSSGAAAARNRAFCECQGDFIQYLDADDVLHSEKVKVQAERLLGRPACVAAGRWGRFVNESRDTKFVSEPFWRDCPPVEFLAEMWQRGSMIQPGGWLTPRPLIEAAGPWDETLTLNDDGEFFARVLLASREVLFCPESVLHYRSGVPGALSSRKTNGAWDSAFRATGSATSRLLAAETSPRTRRACSRVWEEFVYASYPSVSELRRQATSRVRELGGPYFRPPMGPRLRAVSAVTGWKLARRLQLLLSGGRQ